MLLTIDIGNTQTGVGLYSGSKLVCMWRLNTNLRDTADEIRVKLMSLLAQEGFGDIDVKLASLASVVPQLTESWCSALSDGLNAEIIVCTSETASGLFKCKYPRPQEIGADRVADAVAAKVLYGAPVVVVDLGTATNIEVIDADGFFIGGIIAPGVQTSAQALFSRASRLSDIDLVAPNNPIGISTETAIQSGVVFGEADRIDGLVRRIFKQLGYETQVIATGGLSSLISAYSSSITNVNPVLTIEGLRFIADAASV